MIRNYYTLLALVREAAPQLTGARIAELFSQQKDELAVTFAEGAPGLVFSCRPDTSVFYLHPALARAKRNSASLFQEAWNLRIQALSLHRSDRIILLALENGITLAGLLFGTAANVLLLAADGTIKSALRKARALQGTAFRPRDEEIVFDTELLHALPETHAGAPAGPAVRKLYPPLGATLVQELFYRAGVDPSAPAATLDGAALGRLAATLQELLLELQHPAPRIYDEAPGSPALFSIVPLHHAAPAPERLFGSVHEAVRSFVFRRHAADGLASRKGAVLAHLRQLVGKAERTLEAVQHDAGDAARAAEYEGKGSLLMANLPALAKGGQEVHLEGDGGLLRISLDPKLSPVQNAQRYFDKAKRARSAATQSAGRSAELGKRLADARRLLAVVEAVTSTEELKAAMKQHADEFAVLGLGEQGEPEGSPFRRFIVEGGFEVWAGKSSANNDELTLHHARPHDLWFHARGAGGSHVVLRTGTGKGEPGKKAKEQAAAIAAYYSKMKNAGLVPVAMTERRFVRKPRGAKPGTVVIEREKVIFVKPSLPPTP
ncbi:MAG TPA: NFACT RNA binding domain-containing protein [Bacteroidota bacterium]